MNCLTMGMHFIMANCSLGPYFGFKLPGKTCKLQVIPLPITVLFQSRRCICANLGTVSTDFTGVKADAVDTLWPWVISRCMLF